jgi:hydroxyethylthiazole kinase-like uncharacterized protein yjeF
MSPLAVTTAAQAAARDQGAIAAGIPGERLMQQAGQRAAALILQAPPERLQRGVTCWAGPGNNGGDAYVVAAHLARHGVPVRVHAVAPPRTPDARAAAARWTLAAGVGDEPELAPPDRAAGVVVDGLLGTGQQGPLRDPVRRACDRIAAARHAGAWVVALDLPTGVDATTGGCADGHVVAHDTLTFGTLKRGALLARHAVGRLRVLDIGLGPHAQLADQAWQLADPVTLAGRLPPLAWDAHKGTRGRVLVAGGQEGMAGAVVLAAQGALGAGAGLVCAQVAPASVAVLQGAVPQALAAPWPHSAPAPLPLDAHAIALGPGLGREAPAHARLAWARQARAARVREGGAPIPVVLDADALWHLAQQPHPAAHLRDAWGGEAGPVVITPHAGEFARLTGAPVPRDWDARARAVQALATAANAVVLLKGAPTLVAAPAGAADGALWVMPRGTPVLATGGSGDLLTGMLAALLAQGHPPLEGALLAATAHALAAESVHHALGGARGASLAQVVQALPQAWRQLEAPAALPTGVFPEGVLPEGVLADLPAVR